MISLNGISKAASRDLSPHLISYLLVPVEFLGLLADVDLHLADVRRVAKVLIPCRFALNRVHRSFDLGDLSIDGGKGWSRSGIHFGAIRTLHGGVCDPRRHDSGTHKGYRDYAVKLFILVLLCGCAMHNEGPCLSLAPNSLHHQQASGLNLIDVQTQKIRYIRAIRENPTSFVMNKNVVE